MRALVSSAIGAAALWLAGCYFAGPPGKGAKAEAGYRAAVPVIAGLDAYHHDRGRYPSSLRQLVPHYIADPATLTLRGRDFKGFEYHSRGHAYTLGFTYYTSAVNDCSYDSNTKKWDCSGYF
jgi:hypothetical protein